MDSYDYVYRCRFGRLRLGKSPSEDEGKTVLLLEAGGADHNIFIHIPAGFFKTVSNPKVNWLYTTEPEDLW